MARLGTTTVKRPSNTTPNSRIGNHRVAGTSDTLIEESGSDKENRGQSDTTLGKRKSASSRMASPTQPSTSSNKRRKSDDGRGIATAQNARQREISDKVDKDIYDPEQDEVTKQRTLRRLRELNVKFVDSRGDYLQRGSKGIQETLQEAEELIKDVKQTSVATLDSRLLVNVGDLAYKKINTLALGDGSAGIDVEDFLSKTILYMRSGTSTSALQPSSTQRRRPQRSASDDEAEDSTTDLDWAYFGDTICRPLSRRPCLSSFLLGPLSVQKKVRAPTQRRGTQKQTYDPSQATRPVGQDQEDLDQKESANLTETCIKIASLLSRTQAGGETLVEKEVDDLPHEPSDEELRSIMHRHHISDDGQVPLFEFCVNPRSFGQTIENFFYVSFLVKEGKVGIDFDSQGMPTVGMTKEVGLAERQRGEMQRNQAVFTLDFDTFEELVRECGINQSIIPHREEGTYDDGTLPLRITQRESSARRDSVSEDEDMYGSAAG